MREGKTDGHGVRSRLTDTAMWTVPILLAGCASVGPVPASIEAVAPCKNGQRLEVFQDCRFAVSARDVSTVLPVQSTIGDQYRIVVPAGQQWTDLLSGSDPLTGSKGSWLMNLTSKHRRIPDEDWFVLGVALRGSSARPGNGCRKETDARRVMRDDWIRVSQPGDVVLFANDVCGFYWNNNGGIWVRIQRLRTALQP